MEEGVFVEWLKADGDTIEPGDLLFNLEGEKAIQEIESIDSGVLRIPENAPSEGDTVLVGQVIGWLCKPDETPPAELPAVELTLPRPIDLPAQQPIQPIQPTTRWPAQPQRPPHARHPAPAPDVSRPNSASTGKLSQAVAETDGSENAMSELPPVPTPRTRNRPPNSPPQPRCQFEA
jgi:pyruvate/2-oxoglutarate dehydrogenase complex dihydrolipoamide acyltransferase (E2) component